jgi:hypothetical protein
MYRPPDTAEIIQRFASAESRSNAALKHYALTQDFDVSEIADGGQIRGRFKRVSNVSYDNNGNRNEKVTYFPPSTLAEIKISLEDLQDVAGLRPFSLTTDNLSNYQIDFVGKEKIDEVGTYVFDVKPKSANEHSLEGRIWVDDRELQIVKIKGSAVSNQRNKYPIVEIYREQIDGQYWFPTFIHGDDDVLGQHGETVHERLTVKYTNYRKS